MNFQHLSDHQEIY